MGGVAWGSLGWVGWGRAGLTSGYVQRPGGMYQKPQKNLPGYPILLKAKHMADRTSEYCRNMASGAYPMSVKSLARGVQRIRSSVMVLSEGGSGLGWRLWTARDPALL